MGDPSSGTLWLLPLGVRVALRPGSLAEQLLALPSPTIPYGCLAARCGLCRVRIERGAELFAPPSAHERAVLERFGEPKGVRLGCQLRVVRARGEAVLWVLGPADTATDPFLGTA